MRTHLSVLQSEMARKQQEIKDNDLIIEGQNSRIHYQNQVLELGNETLQHQQRQIEENDKIIHKQKEEILALAYQRDYFQSECDGFTISRSWYRDNAENSISASQSSTSSFPALPQLRLPSPRSDTRANVSFEDSSPQGGYMLSERLLVPIEPREDGARNALGGRDTMYLEHLGSGFTVTPEIAKFQGYPGFDHSTSS